MRTREVQKFLNGYPLSMGFIFKIDAPYKNYWEMFIAWACTDTVNKIIYFNKKYLKYLDVFCLEVIIKHELGHAFIGVSNNKNWHNKDWYTNAFKCGFRLENEYELSRRFYMRKDHKRLGYSFDTFLKWRHREEKYYIFQ